MNHPLPYPGSAIAPTEQEVPPAEPLIPFLEHMNGEASGPESLDADELMENMSNIISELKKSGSTLLKTDDAAAALGISTEMMMELAGILKDVGVVEEISAHGLVLATDKSLLPDLERLVETDSKGQALEKELSDMMDELADLNDWIYMLERSVRLPCPRGIAVTDIAAAVAGRSNLPARTARDDIPDALQLIVQAPRDCVASISVPGNGQNHGSLVVSSVPTLEDGDDHGSGQKRTAAGQPGTVFSKKKRIISSYVLPVHMDKRGTLTLPPEVTSLNHTPLGDGVSMAIGMEDGTTRKESFIPLPDTCGPNRTNLRELGLAAVFRNKAGKRGRKK